MFDFLPDWFDWFFTMTDLILVAILLTVIVFMTAFFVVFLWWARKDALYKSQRMMRDRAYVYAKVAERTFKPDAEDVKGDYVIDRMNQPIQPSDAAEAAIHDVARRRQFGQAGEQARR